MTVTVEQSGKLWLDSLQANYLAESTLRKYSKIIRLLSCFFDTKPLASITTADLQAFRASRKIGPNTAAHELQTLKSFLSWAAEQGFIPNNPALKLKPLRMPPNEKVPYTQEEVIRILQECDHVGQHDYERLRCKAAVLVMRYTGLRISDVILLRKDAVRDGYICLQAKKNSVAIRLPLPQVALSALAMLPVPNCANGKRDYFFWNQAGSKDTVIADMQRVLHRVYVLSGVPKSHNHRFRHTLASDLLAKGATLPMVAYVLGISMLICQKHYAKFTPEFQNSVNEVMGRIGQVHGEVRPLSGNNCTGVQNFLDTVPDQEQTLSNLTAH